MGCTDVGARAAVRIYNSSGELVRTLFEGFVPPGSTIALTWDLTNDMGRQVASNVYYIRLFGLDGTAGAKVGVLR